MSAQTLCSGGLADIYPCSGVDLMAHLPLSSFTSPGSSAPSAANDIWGWTDAQTGNEYALIGLTNGTAFVDVTAPASPIYLGKLPTAGSSSSWRDIKTVGDYAFIVSEANGHGMQIFDLTRLRSVVSPPVTFTSDAIYTGIGDAHNIVADEASGFVYAVGAGSCAGGLHMIDVNTPLTPIFAGCYSDDGYTHDAQCVVYTGPDPDHQGKQICVASNEDTITVVDVTNKSVPVQLARVSYPSSSYTHQGWFTEDQRYFVVDDEGDGNSSTPTRTIVMDMLDLDNPSFSFFQSGETNAIDHNLYIHSDRIYQSNYTAGLRILDASDIAGGALPEIAYFDTYPANDNHTFNGQWSNYPFFASGTIIVNDINNGFFALKLADAPDPLEVTCTPQSTPIIIPAGGGSYAYDIAIVNNGVSSQTFNIWLDIDGPGVGRTRGPFTRTLAAGASLMRTVNQNVPGGVPAGDFVHTCSVGTFPTADDSDSFTWTKSATFAPGGVSVADWTTEAVIAAALEAPANAAATDEFSLDAAYPNPFNPSSTLSFYLPEAAHARLIVYDAIGHEVARLVDGMVEAGRHEAVFEGSDLPSGTYFVRFTVGSEFAQIQRLTLLK